MLAKSSVVIYFIISNSLDRDEETVDVSRTGSATSSIDTQPTQFARKSCLGPASCGARRNEFNAGTLRKMHPILRVSTAMLSTFRTSQTRGVLGISWRESTRRWSVENVSGKLSTKLHRVSESKEGRTQ